MNDLEFILDKFSIFAGLKWFLVFGLGVYAVFAFFVMKQIKVMNNALKVKREMMMYLVGVAHFVIALLVLFLALVIL